MKRVEELIQYLTKNGKNKSWVELAKEFGFASESGPRKAWKKHLTNNIDNPIDMRCVTIEEKTTTVSTGGFKPNKIQPYSNPYKPNTSDKKNPFYDHIPSMDEIYKDYRIDKNKYELSDTYIRSSKEGWSVTTKITSNDDKEAFNQRFLDFLKTYTPLPSPALHYNPAHVRLSNEETSLVINIQDPHYNKLDTLGKVDMKEHMNIIKNKIKEVVKKSRMLYDIKKIYYIIGSDHFNSEYTNTTTKGTPQYNSTSFTDGFTKICNHETEIIEWLSAHCEDLYIVFCPGNHDQYVSWHMVKFLEAYYRLWKNVHFDTRPYFTKYYRHGKTVFCINHGDIQKPERLAQNFPDEFEDWSMTKYRYILTGDKHNELSKTFGSIEFYQIPALSPHKSEWDLKNGFTVNPNKLTCFLFSADTGLKMIFKEQIN